MSTSDAATQESRAHRHAVPREPAGEPPLPRFETPIVPQATMSGRALVAVVAIMTFLASLTTGAVMLVRAAASEWQADVAREVTIQVRPAAGPRPRGGHRQGCRPGARVRRGCRGAALFQGGNGAPARAMAGQRRATRGTSGPAHHRRSDRIRRGARRRDTCAGRWASKFRAPASTIIAASSSACAPWPGRSLPAAWACSCSCCRHRALGHVRDPRRHGHQPSGHRGAAFHRRQGQFHRRAFPAAFPAAGAERGTDRRRRRHRAVRARRARQRLVRPARPEATSLPPCSGALPLGVLGYLALLAPVGLIAAVTAAASRHTVNRTIETIH